MTVAGVHSANHPIFSNRLVARYKKPLLKAFSDLRAKDYVIFILHGRDALCVQIAEWAAFHEQHQHLDIVLLIFERIRRISNEVLTGWEPGTKDSLWQAFDLSRLLQVHQGNLIDPVYSRLLLVWQNQSEWRAALHNETIADSRKQAGLTSFRNRPAKIKKKLR